MANIRKRGNKWQVQIRRAGYSSITKTFLRKEEALAWGRSQEVRFDAALAGTFLPVKETLAELLGRYADEVTPKKKSAASEQRRIRRLLSDSISKSKVCELTPDRLIKFRNRRLLDGQRAAAYDLQIIRHTLNHLRSFFFNSCSYFIRTTLQPDYLAPPRIYVNPSFRFLNRETLEFDIHSKFMFLCSANSQKLQP